MTTLSSATGHMHMRVGNAGQGGRRTTLIVVVSAALCAAAAVVVIAISGRTTSQIIENSEAKHRAAEPLPTFTPPPLPTELPALPSRPEPPARAPRASAEDTTEEMPVKDHPEGNRPSSARERGRARSGSHGETRRPGSQHEQGGKLTVATDRPATHPTLPTLPTAPTAPTAPPPNPAPTPTNPNLLPKTITREKF
jgi:hypothetical protein